MTEPETTPERLTRLWIECYKVVGRAVLAAELTELANSTDYKAQTATTIWIEMRRAYDNRQERLAAGPTDAAKAHSMTKTGSGPSKAPKASKGLVPGPGEILCPSCNTVKSWKLRWDPGPKSICLDCFRAARSA